MRPDERETCNRELARGLNEGRLNVVDGVTEQTTVIDNVQDLIIDRKIRSLDNCTEMVGNFSTNCWQPLMTRQI